MEGDEDIRKLMEHEIISAIFADLPLNHVHIVAECPPIGVFDRQQFTHSHPNSPFVGASPCRCHVFRSQLTPLCTCLRPSSIIIRLQFAASLVHRLPIRLQW
jgi:hypothetical protein